MLRSDHRGLRNSQVKLMLTIAVTVLTLTAQILSFKPWLFGFFWGRQSPTLLPDVIVNTFT